MSTAPDGRPALRLGNWPWLHGCFGLIATPAGLLGLFIPEIPLLGKLGMLLVYTGLGLVALSLARERWTTLRVGDRIVWTRPGVRHDLPLSAARRVVILRTSRPLREPTDYLLEVELEGQLVRLHFAEHLLWGGPASRRAEALAQRLQVPIRDDLGEEYRRSRWLLWRWLGRGQSGPWSCPSQRWCSASWACWSPWSAPFDPLRPDRPRAPG